MTLHAEDARWLSSLREALQARSPRTLDRTRVPGSFRDAGVLAPLWADGGRMHVLLMKRPDTMPSHQGEISFPGGRKDEPDRDLLQTALREAREEVGLQAEGWEVLGCMDEVWSVGRYIVRPWVAWSEARPVWQPSPREAEALVEVPVAQLLEPGVHRVERFKWSGVRISVHYYTVGEHVIWGLTGGILYRMLSWMQGEEPVDEANDEASLLAWLRSAAQRSS